MIPVANMVTPNVVATIIQCEYRKSADIALKNNPAMCAIALKKHIALRHIKRSPKANARNIANGNNTTAPAR